MSLVTHLVRSFRCFSTYYHRQIPRTAFLHKEFQSVEIEQPEGSKLLRVAIVGCPNAGKSTLLNQLVNWKVSAVSSKVHTTRNNVIGVFMEDNVQIEFIDTPGLVSDKQMSKYKLENSFLTDLNDSMMNSDIVAILTDASNRRERTNLNPGILDLLRNNRDKESILVINKVDKVKCKRDLLLLTETLTSGFVGGYQIQKPEKKGVQFELTRGNFDRLFEKTEKHYLQYHDTNEEKNIDTKEDSIGWPNFNQVFMISALNNDGIDELRSYLLSKAQFRPWLYNRDAVTTKKPKALIIDALREVCLELLYQEIPYKLNFQIVMWELDAMDNLYIVVNLYCPSKFQSLIIGPKGSTISTIVRKSKEALCNIFRCDVSLKLAVKPTKQE